MAYFQGSDNYDYVDVETEFATVDRFNLIETFGGDDRVYGYIWRDVIYLGNGADTASAGAGDDIIFGDSVKSAIGTGSGTIDDPFVYESTDFYSTHIYTDELGCRLIKPQPQSHGGKFCESEVG